MFLELRSCTFLYCCNAHHNQMNCLNCASISSTFIELALSGGFPCVCLPYENHGMAFVQLRASPCLQLSDGNDRAAFSVWIVLHVSPSIAVWLPYSCRMVTANVAYGGFHTSTGDMKNPFSSICGANYQFCLSLPQSNLIYSWNVPHCYTTADCILSKSSFSSYVLLLSKNERYKYLMNKYKHYFL